MGQYYHAVLERNGKRQVAMPVVNGDWQGLKLMEHSWFRNSFMSVIAKKLLKKPTRVIWCGDYAEDVELQALNPELNLDNTYNSKKAKGVTCKNINLDILKGKYLVNHDKKVYIDLDRYSLIAEEFNKGTGWESYVANPISILTAVGNDRGGGDYYSGDRTTCFEHVGTWAYDLISIETKAPTDYKEERHIIFTEHVTDENRHLVDVYGLNTTLASTCI